VAGAIFVGVGGVVALLPDDLGPFSRALVIVVSLASLLVLAYAFAVERLVLDRRVALSRAGTESVHTPRLQAQQSVTWALLHPLYDEDRETKKRRDAAERAEQSQR
jgi:hypothetical protein